MYKSLHDILKEAYDQAAHGKGAVRHAVNTAGTVTQKFEDQPICTITKQLGLGFPLGQAIKKILESRRLDVDSGVQELLGAINYIAAAIIVLRSSSPQP